MIIDRTTRRVDVMIADDQVDKVDRSNSEVEISISPEEIAVEGQLGIRYGATGDPWFLEVHLGIRGFFGGNWGAYFFGGNWGSFATGDPSFDLVDGRHCI